MKEKEESETAQNKVRGEYQSLERQFSGIQRQIIEYSRQLQSKEQEILQVQADRATERG